MLLEYNEEKDKGLCNADELQRRSTAASVSLAIILTVLIFIVVNVYRIHHNLVKSDLDYEDGRYFGVLADIDLDLDQNVSHCHVWSGSNDKWKAHFSSVYGFKDCDSSFTLLNTTISQLYEIQSQTKPFEFILVISNQIGHWIKGSKESAESISKVHNRIYYYFPSTPVYFVLGNQDAASFHSIPSGEVEQWYASISKNLFPSFHTTESQEILSAAETFHKYGFYKLEHSPSLWVIALNTQAFLDDADIILASSALIIKAEIIDAQIDWLNKTLLLAEQKKTVSVLLIGHAAPELKLIDVTSWGSNRRMTWKSDCVTRFNEIVGRFSGIIKLSFFAHQHADSWYVGKGPEGGHVSHFLMPSVSPASRGHPSFSVGVTDTHWGLLDLLYYHSPVEMFARTNKTPSYLFQYSFKQQYFLQDQKYAVIDGALLEGLTKRIIDIEDGLSTYNTRLMNTHQYRYKPHVSPFQMYCAMTENTVNGLDSCLKKYSF